MKADKQKIQEVENALDDVPVLGCAGCIAEKITEGHWDRFGTTEQQELEATCEKHLIENEKFYREHKYLDDRNLADKIASELERRRE